jgi:hypothetical protein
MFPIFCFNSSLSLRWYRVLPSVGCIMHVSTLERPDVIEPRPATMGLSGPPSLCTFSCPWMQGGKCKLWRISW